MRFSPNMANFNLDGSLSYDPRLSLIRLACHLQKNGVCKSKPILTVFFKGISKLYLIICIEYLWYKVHITTLRSLNVG